MKKCILAGTFDPPTLGHKTLIDSGLEMFDELVVALLVNPSKAPYFTLEERKEMLALMVDAKRVRIIEWEGTVAELLKAEAFGFRHERDTERIAVEGG